jgi:hypothetical protein
VILETGRPSGRPFPWPVATSALPLSEVVLAERGLLDPETEVLVQPGAGDVGSRHLQVVQLGGHPARAVADLRAKVAQVDQEPQGVAVVGRLVGHLCV